MNSQEYRNLQEAYLNVYQEEVLDEVRGGGEIDPVSDIPGIGLRGARSPAAAGLKMSPLDRAKARENALKKRGTPEAKKRASDINKNFIRPTEKAVHRSLLAATNARHAEKTRLQALNNSYEPDLYDAILEHLVAEGYADTNKSALVIMANMSEDWRENILDESGLSQDTIQSAVIKRQKRNDAALAKDTPEGNAEFEKGWQKVKRSKSQLNINKKKAREGPTVRMGLNNSYDLYDVILSHLLDEGYADTNENALVIMANMSEDWRESIVEEDEKLLKARKKSISRLNAQKNIEPTEEDEDNKNSIDLSNPYSSRSTSGYREVQTDYHARKLRASGR